MKVITIEKFVCDLCGHAYDSRASALKCESRPVAHDDVKIGDFVRIKTGEGAGQLVKVEGKHVVSMEWGHRAWERYWHTVTVDGPVVGSWGNRSLTFDAREKVSPAG